MSTVAETATLAHGYTMAEINRIAGVVVSKDHYSRPLDYDDRIACAWHAVVEALYTAERPPVFGELYVAGLQALSAEMSKYRQLHGVAKEGLAPRFQVYWRPTHVERTDGFSDRLVEKMALHDVLGLLTDRQYEAVSTLAAFDNDRRAAADALGIKYDAFNMRINDARKRINAVWYDGETPPKRRSSSDDACAAGHNRAEHGLKREGKWVCRKCDSARRRRIAARDGWRPTKAAT